MASLLVSDGDRPLDNIVRIVFAIEQTIQTVGMTRLHC
jgi:hypothetical protein